MAKTTTTILLVDDEVPAREAMREVLREHGYLILEANDYGEAVTRCQQHSGVVDLLLTDLSLPGKNGYELATTLQKSEPDLKVLFISGRAGAQVCRFYGLSTTDVHFLEKPFATSDLIERVAHVLRWPGPISRSAST